ncbi:MAG: hypothetical protein KGZ50_04470 [Peptococcaceae bacterium]|nr:hypothetical protein [Peptococcaceae bacterium]
MDNAPVVRCYENPPRPVPYLCVQGSGVTWHADPRSDEVLLRRPRTTPFPLRYFRLLVKDGQRTIGQRTIGALLRG